MTTEAPEFMLIFRESTPERYAVMTVDERRQALRDWNDWCDRLVTQGTLRSGNPLHPVARVVSAKRDTRILDGPFAEAKELIGGYFLLSAQDFDEAIAVAEESPNLKFGMTVEIRQIAGGCHLARSLGLTGMREPEPA